VVLKKVNSVGGRLVAGFVLPVLVLAIVGAVAYRNTTALENDSRSVDHTYQVLEGVEAIAATLKDAETGQRGFVITGEDRYLAPYTAALGAIDGVIDNVEGLTADNPAQQKRIDALRPLVQQKLAELAETIDLRRAQGYQAALEVVLTDKGKAVMDQIREILAGLSDAERKLLTVRSAGTAATADTSRGFILGGMAVAVVLVVLVSGLVLRSILGPLGALRRRLTEIADGEGDLTQRLDEGRHDEFGTVAAVFNRFMAKLAGAMGQIGTQAGGLAEAAERLAASSTQIANAADATSQQATVVSAATEEMSATVSTVAAGAEEMGSSIREIANNAAEATRVVAEAVEVAETANHTVGQLGDSSMEIGNVVKLITSIAEQTNLLALNATIEAARAGEAGKGFAVVASEVKDLAQETGRATEDIGRRVDSIQADVDNATRAIARLGEIVARVNDFQTTIASAVEEQTATTTEMSRSVTDASSVTQQISENISGVAQSATDTTAVVTDTRQAVTELAEMGATLRAVVGQFRY
jgi:methyl-accepting chemotaxis protein